MCVIIAKPAGKIVEAELLHNCWKWNKDGGGLAYADKEAKKLIIKKGFDKEEEFLAEIAKLDNLDAVIHFRRASAGMTQKDPILFAKNCHPFAFGVEPNETDKEYNISFAVFHNGRLEWGHTDECSDSSLFTEQVLKPMMTDNPFHLDIENNRLMLERAIQYRAGVGWHDPNKMVIGTYDRRDNTMVWHIIGEKYGCWDKKNGCWFSNTTDPWKDKEYYKNNWEFGYGGDDKATTTEPGLCGINLHGVWISPGWRKHFETPDENGWSYNFIKEVWINDRTKNELKTLSIRQLPSEVVKSANKRYEDGKKQEVEKKKTKKQNVYSAMDHIFPDERKMLCGVLDKFCEQSFLYSQSTKTWKQWEKITFLREIAWDILEDAKSFVDAMQLDCWMMGKAKDGKLLQILIDAENRTPPTQNSSDAQIIPINHHP